METERLEISDDALKILVAEHGVRGTARMLGMDEKQTHSFRQRVTRGKWLQDPAMSKLREINKVPNARTPKPIVAAMSPQQAIAHELQALGVQTRLGHAKAAAAIADKIATRDAEENLIDMQNVKAAGQHADLIYGWKDSTPNVKIRLDVLNAPSEQPVFEVQAEVTSSESWDNELDEY